MTDNKVTVMVLKVDLQCPFCYKKVKKILCKFPQIRDQIYDEKANTVTITVFCCDPEKIRDKLCCKGAPVIKSIEIKEKTKEPERPKQPEKPKEPVKPKEPAEKPKVVVIEKPKVVIPEKPKEPEKPKQVEEAQEKPKEVEKPKELEKPKEVEKPKEAPKSEPPKIIPQAAPNFPPPEPVVGPSWPMPVNEYPATYPVRTCCGECYEGYGGGPCYNGYGTPQPCYDEYYGYGYGYGRGCPMRRCDYYYFSDENPHGCSIM